MMLLTTFSCMQIECPLNTIYDSAKSICVPIKAGLSCKIYTERVQCIENNYCNWLDGICIDKQAEASIINPDPVVPDPLVPDPDIPTVDLLCKNITKQEDCANNYCDWSLDASICQNPTSNCATRINADQCLQGGECLWDKDTTKCISPSWPCATYITNCPTSSGCEWSGWRWCVAT